MTVSQVGDFPIFISEQRMPPSNFGGLNGEGVQIASPCQISSRWVKPLLMTINRFFQDGGRRHLGFLNFRIFRVQNGNHGQTASLWKISWRSVKALLKYSDFSIFLSWAAAILDF